MTTTDTEPTRWRKKPVEIGVGEGERVGDLRGRGLGCRDAGIVCGVVGFRGTRLWGFLWLKWARPRPRPTPTT